MYCDETNQLKTINSAPLSLSLSLSHSLELRTFHLILLDAEIYLKKAEDKATAAAGAAARSLLQGHRHIWTSVFIFSFQQVSSCRCKSVELNFSEKIYVELFLIGCGMLRKFNV